MGIQLVNRLSVNQLLILRSFTLLKQLKEKKKKKACLCVSLRWVGVDVLLPVHILVQDL